MSAKPSLVTIDDDPEVRTFVRTIATRIGFSVTEISDAATFTDVVSRLRPAVVVLDLNMPSVDGVTLMRQLRDLKSDAYVLLISGCDARTLQTVTELARAYGLRTLGTVQKPATVAAVEQLLRSIQVTAPSVTVQDLREALTEGHVRAYYQPKAHWRQGTWQIDSVEALARWEHRQLGFISPAQFIPLAEGANLIGRLTDTVMHQTLQQVRLWANSGMKISAAVNLSPLLVNDLEFPDRIRALLQKHRVDSSQFALEVTESAAITESRDAMDVLTRLRVLGVGLAIDDFGTGTSSLLQLFRMPFNELKIDQCFVSRIPESDEARRIVKATVDLAHTLNISACAEGVESPAILDFLQSAGCDMAQGYHISPAVPGDKLAEVLATWNQGAPRPARPAARPG